MKEQEVIKNFKIYSNKFGGIKISSTFASPFKTAVLNCNKKQDWSNRRNDKKTLKFIQISLEVLKLVLLLHPLSKQRFWIVAKSKIEATEEKIKNFRIYSNKFGGIKINSTFASAFETAVLNVEDKVWK